MAKSENASQWHDLPIKALPVDIAKLAFEAGKALDKLKVALEEGMASTTPQGKVARFSFKRLDAKGEGLTFAYFDAPKPKATPTAKEAKLNVKALFTPTVSVLLGPDKKPKRSK